MRLTLVPVGHRVEIVGTVIGVAAFERDLNGPVKGNRRIRME